MMNQDIGGQSDVLEFSADAPGKTLQTALHRIDDLENNQHKIREENESELNKLRAWYRQLEVKWQEEKARADQESANTQLAMVEKQNLQEQINELQNAAGNMASTADRVHKWLEERTHTLKKCWEQEKSRADRNATSVQSLTQEKQELVQQLNELHAAADNMVTGAAESVHQLVEEKTKESLQEAAQEKARAEAEAARNAILAREKELLLEQLQELQQQAGDEPAAAAMTPRQGQVQKGKPVDPCRYEGAIRGSPTSDSTSRLATVSTASVIRSAIEATPVFGASGTTTLLGLPADGVTRGVSPVQGVSPVMSHVQLSPVLPPAAAQTLSTTSQSSGMPRWAYRAETTPPGYGYQSLTAPSAPLGSATGVANGVLNAWPQQASTPRAQSVPQQASPYAAFNPNVTRQKSPVNPNVTRQTSPAVGVRRETTPVQTPRLRSTLGVARESEVVELLAASPTTTLQSPRRQVARETSPFPIVRQVSPLLNAREEIRQMRAISEPSKRMRSMERPLERAMSGAMERSSSQRERPQLTERRMMEPSVSVTTLESLAQQAAAEAQAQQQQQQQSFQQLGAIGAATAPSMAGSTASLPGPVWSLPSPLQPGGITSASGQLFAYAQPAPAVIRQISPAREMSPVRQSRIIAVRQLSPTSFARPLSPRASTASAGVVRAVSHCLRSSSQNLLASSDSRSSSVFRSASNPVSSSSSPIGSRSGSVVPPPKVQRAKRSESAQLPRLTSGVPWQPSDDGVVIATLEENQRVLDATDPLSASVRSLVSDGVQSGVTCLEGVSVSTAMGGMGVYESLLPTSPPPSQRVSLKAFQDSNSLVTVGSLRGGLGSPRSPYKQSASSTVIQPRVVPLISRLPTGSKPAVVPSQDFLCGSEGTFLRERSDPLPNFSPAVDARGQGPSLSDRGSLLWAGNHAALPAKLLQSPGAMQMMGDGVTSHLDLKSKSLTLPVGTSAAAGYGAGYFDPATAQGLQQAQLYEMTGTPKPVRMIPAINAISPTATLRPANAVRKDPLMESGGRGRSPKRLPQTPRGQISRAEYVEYTPRTARPGPTLTPQSVLPGVRMGLCTSR